MKAPSMKRRLILATLAGVSAVGPALVGEAGAQVMHTPERGSAERADILDAVRPAAEAVLHPPVEFVVAKMNVAQGWAFVRLEPQRPGGGRIDPAETRLAEDAANGALDGLTTYALLWYRYGHWNLIAWVIGPTDVAWDPWPVWYGAPEAIFE